MTRDPADWPGPCIWMLAFPGTSKPGPQTNMTNSSHESIRSPTTVDPRQRLRLLSRSRPISGRSQLTLTNRSMLSMLGMEYYIQQLNLYSFQSMLEAETQPIQRHSTTVFRVADPQHSPIQPRPFSCQHAMSHRIVVSVSLFVAVYLSMHIPRKYQDHLV
jgi:hypothetical protein